MGDDILERGYRYASRHIRTEVNKLYHDILTQRCILEQQVFRNTLTLATQSPDEFAYHLLKLIIILHNVKCIPVEVKYRKTEQLNKLQFILSTNVPFW